jgi:hypothetical protein
MTLPARTIAGAAVKARAMVVSELWANSDPGTISEQFHTKPHAREIAILCGTSLLSG